MKHTILSLIVLLLPSCGVIDIKRDSNQIKWDSNQNGRIVADIHLGILVADIAEESIDVQKEALVVLHNTFSHS